MLQRRVYRGHAVSAQPGRACSAGACWQTVCLQRQLKARSGSIPTTMRYQQARTRRAGATPVALYRQSQCRSSLVIGCPTAGCLQRPGADHTQECLAGEGGRWSAVQVSGQGAASAWCRWEGAKRDAVLSAQQTCIGLPPQVAGWHVWTCWLLSDEKAPSGAAPAAITGQPASWGPATPARHKHNNQAVGGLAQLITPQAHPPGPKLLASAARPCCQEWHTPSLSCQSAC